MDYVHNMPFWRVKHVKKVLYGEIFMHGVSHLLPESVDKTKDNHGMSCKNGGKADGNAKFPNYFQNAGVRMQKMPIEYTLRIHMTPPYFAQKQFYYNPPPNTLSYGNLLPSIGHLPIQGWGMGMRFIVIKRKTALWLVAGAVLVLAGIITAIVLGTAQPAGGTHFSDMKINATIVIDAGHGGLDGGAVGKTSKVREDGLNLIVAQKLRAELERHGMIVVMTRTDANALGPNKKADMSKRRQIVQETNPDLLISIHMNSIPDTRCIGPQVFYMEGSPGGEKIAAAIQKAMNEGTGNKRVCKEENYYMLRSGEKPGVIVECGFLSNTEEEKLLQQEDYQNKLAQLICTGVLDYFSQNPVQPSTPAPSPTPSIID